MEKVVSSSALSASDRDRLAQLLASAPAPRRWAAQHRHQPLLCALGIVEAPEPGYARAVGRRFADPSELRSRALALLEELDRESRTERYEQRRSARPRLWASMPFH